jgi:SAM-dependent methyltransferase
VPEKRDRPRPRLKSKGQESEADRDPAAGRGDAGIIAAMSTFPAAGPDVAFWQARFESDATPWDRGAPHPWLVDAVDGGALAPCRLLVPGCGSGHEVAFLARRGFDVTGLDYAPAAVARARERLAGAGDVAGRADVVLADALQWRPPRPFDAIHEQTCLCALHPDRWMDYAAQLHRWLVPGGRLVAMVVQVPRDGAARGLIEGPPYHCDINAVRALLPADRWAWPRPPYARLPHPAGFAELAVELIRR